MTEPRLHKSHLGPLSFAQITAGLVWPTLCRAFPLALAPARLIVAVLTVAALGLVGQLFDAVRGEVEGQRGAFDAFASALAAIFGRPAPSDMGFHDAPFWVNAGSAAGWFQTLAINHPATTIALFVLLVPVLLIGGAAIARMTALDVAGDLYMSSREGLAYAAKRIPSLFAAVMIPVILAALLALVLALFGALLLSLPVISIVGAIAYGLFLLLGLFFVLVLVGFAFAFPLIIPGIAVESTDSFDALQRAYSYVFGRSGRLLVYIAIVIGQGIVGIFVVTWILGAVVRTTRALTTAWLGDAATERLQSMAGESATFTAQLIGFWENVVGLISAGFILSFFFTASTLLYLVARRVNDEQDIRDIWMPGLVGGTVAVPPAPLQEGEDDRSNDQADVDERAD